MERSDLESSLASKLTDLCIKVPLLYAIREICICTRIIRELCLKNLGRKRIEPQTIQFVGLAAEFMTRFAQMEKYTDPRNSIVSV